MTRTLIPLAALMLSACTLPNMNEQPVEQALVHADAEEAEAAWQAVYLPPRDSADTDSLFRAEVAGELVSLDDGALVLEDHEMTLRLAAWGRDRLDPVEDVPGVQVGNRVLFKRGGIVEWYINRADGIEQGFDLAGAPAGDGDLRLRLQLGGAQAERVDDATHVRFLSDHRAVEYGYLSAWDAKGQDLTITVEPFEHGIDLVFDDAGAEYPLHVMPFIDLSAPAAPTIYPAYKG